jgi:lipopolysaccharide/colanic/teichoic acid biosynthesis glycosyltransferase
MMPIYDVLRIARTPRPWEDYARRIVDIVVGVVLIVILAPVLLAIPVLILLSSPGPVLFRQQRVGLNRAPFTIFKYRTMVLGCDDRAHRELISRELRGEDTIVDGSSKLHADPRVTRVGAFLRRTSLDELPQLFNVLRGEMSLVGPRPCLPWESEMFPAAFAPRFSVRPGITGLWQISGRSAMGTLDMLQLDLVYVRARGFWRDLVIIALTIPSMLRSDGAR